MGYKIHRVLWKYSVGRVIPFCPVGVDGVLFEAGAVAPFKYHLLYELLRIKAFWDFWKIFNHHTTTTTPLRQDTYILCETDGHNQKSF